MEKVLGYKFVCTKPLMPKQETYLKGFIVSILHPYHSPLTNNDIDLYYANNKKRVSMESIQEVNMCKYLYASLLHVCIDLKVWQ